jgi:predicted nuclease of predicted toxin-antitoxin system
VNILLDMNLSPSWITCLESGGHSPVHWSSIGSPSALDIEIMAWARENRYVVFANDLDYGALLFATGAASPSVIQIRTEDIRPTSAGDAVLFALQAAGEDLSAGALVTIDPRRLRISTLPLRRRTSEPS